MVRYWPFPGGYVEEETNGSVLLFVLKHMQDAPISTPMLVILLEKIGLPHSSNATNAQLALEHRVACHSHFLAFPFPASAFFAPAPPIAAALNFASLSLSLFLSLSSRSSFSACFLAASASRLSFT